MLSVVVWLGSAPETVAWKSGALHPGFSKPPGLLKLSVDLAIEDGGFHLKEVTLIVHSLSITGPVF